MNASRCGLGQRWVWSVALLMAACGEKGEPKSGAAEVAATSTPQTVAPPRDASAKPKRLVILGFDGVDPRWLEQWARAGKLPTMAKLMEANGGSGYRPLTSTNPPQSPVAWTTFATGTLPGDHGIFDFIARSVNPSDGGLSILLGIATTSFEVQPSGPPVVRNLRTGSPFWQELGNAGVRVVALNVPYSFPPDAMREGRMVSGLGVPDLRETNSTFTYVGTDVTAEQAKRQPGGGMLVPLTLAGGAGSFELDGPTVPGSYDRMKVHFDVKANADDAVITYQGKSVTLVPGAFSDFLEIDFEQDSLHIKGVFKMLAMETGKRLRLFITPLSFHPRAPYSPFSYPRAFSAKVADDLGRFYKTVGWDHDTSALNAEVVDDETFLKDMDSIETDRREMLHDRLDQPDWDMLIWVSTATDRVAHMFYRLMDKEHPRYDEALAKRHGDAVEREYIRMDKTVASVLPKLGPDDTLLILSDHGFHNYRRGLHINQWLRQQGLLALKSGAESSTRDAFIDVDWTKTNAYSVGTGQIYVNLKGRERDGIVAPEEMPALVKQIHDGLLALRDKERKDASVVVNVYTGADVFKGTRGPDAPDMQIAFAENYRTSWETILGGVPKGVFADNNKKWSGDHASSDVRETPGILLSNRAITSDTPGIVDFAPTAHAYFGKNAPSHYVGKSFLAAPAP